MPANPNRLDIYMRADRREKLVRLAARFAAEGLDVLDNRGHVSLSKTVGILIDGAAAEAPRRVRREERDRERR